MNHKNQNFGDKITVDVSDPVRLRKTAEGFLEIKCYQWIHVLKKSVPMVFRFSPEAGRQLVHAIQVALESGAIVIEQDNTKPNVQ